MKSEAIVAIMFALALPNSPHAKAASEGAVLPPSFTNYLKAFLAQHSETGADPLTEVIGRKVDLGTFNREAYVVYVQGGGWCGTGGCNTMIAARRGQSYKILAFVPATELPIVSLPSFHGGGRDVAVTLKGALNGDHFDPPTRAVLSLTNGRYRFKKPIVASSAIGVGDVLIPAEAKPMPLYGNVSR